VESAHAQRDTGEAGEDRLVLAVASGKGGTGKTLVATTIAVGAADRGLRTVLIDCDADAPNDHIFLPRAEEHAIRVSAPVAAVDPAGCTSCGACSRACAFGAIRVLGRSALVFDELCHGCGLCADVCPKDAISMHGIGVGSVIDGPTERDPGLRLVSAVLDIGQVKAPDVIRAAVACGMEAGSDLVVLDAPPGVACSVVAAVCEADALLLVTEPTAFGLHDLGLAVELGGELGIPMGIVANKVTPENAGMLEMLSRFEHVPVVCKVPFSRRTAEVYARGELAIDDSTAMTAQLDPVLCWADSVVRDEPSGAMMSG